MSQYHSQLLRAVQDMERVSVDIQTTRDKLRDELTFSSITMDIPLPEDDKINPAVEGLLQEVPGFDGYSALLMDAQDRVTVYGTLEIVYTLKEILATQREIAMILRKD